MGKFVLITMANVAELEAGLISERTKAALKAAKAERGVTLGRHGAEVLAAKYRDEARQRALQLEPVMREMQSDGYSMRRMAIELTNRKVKTPRGGAWHPQTVKQVMKRLAC